MNIKQIIGLEILLIIATMFISAWTVDSPNKWITIWIFLFILANGVIWGINLLKGG